jgi:hypothetical protein
VQPAVAVPEAQPAGCRDAGVLGEGCAQDLQQLGRQVPVRWGLGLRGPVRRMLLGGSRLGRWPILARVPGEDGSNSEKDNPQEPRPGGRRANPPAPGRWAPGGHQRPEELPRPSRVSLERVSSYDPKAA